MPLFTRISKGFLTMLKITGGILVITIAVFIIARMFTHVARAEAAAATYYPHFCLGGWEYPQHASGPASIDTNTDASSFTTTNSAFLGASVSSQIFCGYFPVKSLQNSPTKVTVSFNWSMAFSGISSPHIPDPTSYTSTSTNSSPISPSTGFTVPPTVPIVPIIPPPPPPPTDPTPPGNPVIPPSDPTPPPTDPTPPGDTGGQQSQGSPQSIRVQQSVLAALENFVAPEAKAQVIGDVSSSTSPSISLNDILDVSYSLDGIRWISAGHVNRSNWHNFSVDIPVTSWDDLKRLQIMVSVLPSLDDKPDIYLESIALNVKYGQSLADMAANGLAAVGDAIDNVLGDPEASDTPDTVTPPLPPPPPPAPVIPFTTQIVHKKLFFSFGGSVVNLPSGSPIHTDTSGGGSSVAISGDCKDKYYVILLYRNQEDYAKKASSYIANEAHECIGNTFTFNLATLSPDIPPGSYYLLTGAEGDTGTWRATGNLLPVTITASTSIETIRE